MRASLVCIVPDGSVPSDGTLARVQTPAEVHWPIGDSGTISISVTGEDGEVYDLSGSTVTLVCREHAADVAPVFAYTATLDPTPPGGNAPGTASVPVDGEDQATMIAGRVYWFDVRLEDGDDVFHILPPSKWIPQMTIAKTGEPAA